MDEAGGVRSLRRNPGGSKGSRGPEAAHRAASLLLTGAAASFVLGVSGGAAVASAAAVAPGATTPGPTSAGRAGVPSVAARREDLPEVTGVTPASGPVDGGTSVTITGAALTGATDVEFGSVPAASFVVNSATSITATSPPEPAGRVRVAVTTAAGRSRGSSKESFRFRPAITSVSPGTGSLGGGTTVTLRGSGFAVGTGTAITFGVVKATSAVCATTSECTAVAPPLAVRNQTGLVDVQARTNGVASAIVPADRFTYYGLLLTGGSGNRLAVGTRVILRDATFGAASECYAFVEGTVTANSGEPVISKTYALGFGHCEPLPREWFGGLPAGFSMRIEADGTARIQGGMGMLNPYGCEYETDEMSGRLGETRYLRVTLHGTLTLNKSRAQEDWESELSETRSEIRALEEGPETAAEQEELEQLRAYAAGLEAKISEREQECSPTDTIGMDVEAERVGFNFVP